MQSPQRSTPSPPFPTPAPPPSLYPPQASLHHVPSHPILSLQRFTLSDLEIEAGERAEALRQMEACAAAMAVSHGSKSTLLRAARERLAELRA